jgi:hypothetical protein
MIFDASERQTQDPGTIQSYLKGRLTDEDHPAREKGCCKL